MAYTVFVWDYRFKRKRVELGVERVIRLGISPWVTRISINGGIFNPFVFRYKR
jgi:hypothetical protein